MNPVLSAVVITPDDWRTMRRTLAALRAQTVASQLEVVLVGPDFKALEVPSNELAPFASVRQARFHRREMGHATAQGVRAATTDLVWFTEDHCYPLPGCMEAIVNHFTDPQLVALGPTLVNGNPRSLTSWTQFVMEYGPYSAVGAKGQARQIPGHNSCYRRSALLALEPDLDHQLEVETLMQWDMADQGLKLINTADVVTRHYNTSNWKSYLSFSWVFPRTFAAHRGLREGRLARLKLGLLWPLIPVLRFKRLWPLAFRLVGARRAMWLAPGLLLNLVASGASEAKGYLTGDGANCQQGFELEFHRERFFAQGDSFPSAEELAAPSQSTAHSNSAID